MINKSRAESFTKNAMLYDRVRSGYPQAMMTDIDRYIPNRKSVSFLEIGAGNGIATREVYRYWQSPITAIEPGRELFDLLQRRFAQNPDIRLCHYTFEEFQSDEIYDCIFSGTAFHWIDPDVRYTKTARLLNDDGILVLFWNNYSRSDEKIFDRFQEIYKKYHPDVQKKVDIRPLQREKITRRMEELNHAPEFDFLYHGEYNITRQFTAEEYVQLLQTFSMNAVQPAGELDLFYYHIDRLILENGNRLDLPIIINLEIGRVVRDRVTR